MSWGRLGLGAVLVVLLGVPVLLAPRGEAARRAAAASDASTVVIFTPHNEQIRQEFADAFSRWHQERYGSPASVAWSTPGGTSEIRKMLESAYAADLRRGAPVGGQGDLLFGGGSYEFTRLAKDLSVEVDGAKRTTTVLQPLPLDRALLDEVYGPGQDGKPPLIGDVPLYDAKGNWYGAAMSGFGIVWNRDVLATLGVPEPRTWADLGDPALEGWIALVNPAQSGSVTTALDAILQRRGWTDGWRILRRMAANARTFSASSPKAPTDVSIGDAAAGVCIDFYGRYQAQAVKDAGDGGDRVGYIDPAGETTIDPDPIAVLRGAPHPELARRFVEFALSREGQALWQFHARSKVPAADGLGPERYELRRMPVRRDLYAKDRSRFVDDVDPWAVATAVEKPNPNFRDLLPSLFVAMAIENRAGLQAAWRAIVEHPAYPRGERGIVGAEDVSDPTLKAMLERFDAMPAIEGPNGATYDLAREESLGPVRDGWLKRGWKDANIWPADAAPAEELRARMTRAFRDRYREIVELARGERGADR